MAPSPAELATSAAAVAASSEQAGRPVSSSEAEAIARFYLLMLDWNRHINVTGASSLQDLLDEHLPDSLALDRICGHPAAAVDIGSGGGLPALPFLVLRPGLAMRLVEPRAKRASFLRTAVRELGLGADVVTARLEDTDGTFDLVTSRATFEPTEWVERGRRLVRPGGRLVAFLHGGPLPAELPPPLEELAYAAGTRARRILTFGAA